MLNSYKISLNLPKMLAMVTYQIQIPESNRDAFLDILKSLKRLGVVSSFQVSSSWVHPGDTLDEGELLSMLAASEIQAEAGLVIPAEEAASFVRAWKRRKK